MTGWESIRHILTLKGLKLSKILLAVTMLLGTVYAVPLLGDTLLHGTQSIVLLLADTTLHGTGSTVKLSFIVPFGGDTFSSIDPSGRTHALWQTLNSTWGFGCLARGHLTRG